MYYTKLMHKLYTKLNVVIVAFDVLFFVIVQTYLYFIKS